MVVEPYSVDPRGEWSERQAQRVLDIIQTEAKARGLEFVAIEITTQNMPARRYILSARCIRHEVHVSPDSACVRCMHAPSCCIHSFTDADHNGFGPTCNCGLII